MIKITGNESAMPTDHNVDGNLVLYGGLTIRQQLAAMCLSALLVNSEGESTPEEFAKTSIKHADALIAELNKEQ